MRKKTDLVRSVFPKIRGVFLRYLKILTDNTFLDIKAKVLRISDQTFVRRQVYVNWLAAIQM